MSSQKISHNADLVLSALSEFSEPASMRMIARATGTAAVKSLEKHQVRTAIESHLRDDFVDGYTKIEKGNEVEYFVLTEEAEARVQSSPSDSEYSDHADRITELEEEVKQLGNAMKDVTEFTSDVSEKFIQIDEDFSAVAYYSRIELPNSDSQLYNDKYGDGEDN